MKLSRSTAEIFIPDGLSVSKALARTSLLCVAAHHDDIEIMASHAILECFGRSDKWFMGVVVTNGAESPRTDLYAQYTDKQMQAVRKSEQRKAAIVGEFGALALLDHPGSAVKNPQEKDVREDIRHLVLAAKPDVLIGHNLADKHDTHVALALRTIAALRSLPPKARPRKYYGGEVWRDLDWILDEEKVRWDVSKRENIQMALLGVFDSQISGGKRYDLAALGRRRAAATYSESHQVDTATALSVAMDMTPLLLDDRMDPLEFTEGFVERLKKDIRKRIGKFR
jgi:LmbE family N-acetylglucosaminyl deacetylase